MRASPKTRLLMVVAALLLVPVFFTPLWSIGLVAPQYSDGLGMDIYVNDIRGHDRHDIQNINILNHYIGMQEINPEEIPELRIMPWVLLGLIVTGVAAGALGRPRIMAGWLLLFVGAGIAGMVDFYLWNIDYGHNLSPDAPIRIPGMTYSPPILGTSQLLNIRASSWPGVGTGFITVAVLLSGWATWRAFREGKTGSDAPGGAAASGAPVGTAASAPTSEAVEAAGPDNPSSPSGDARKTASPAGRGAAHALLLLALVAAASGCDQVAPLKGQLPGTAGWGGSGEAASSAAALARAPVQPPASDLDRMPFDGRQDPYCQVPVEEIRWGGVVETTAGERIHFASAACLAGHLLSGATSPDQVARIRVVDFAQGEKLVDAPSAHFLLTPNRKAPAGPQGPSLVAIETERLAVNLQEAYSGRLVGWEEALRTMARAWELPAPTPALLARGTP